MDGIAIVGMGCRFPGGVASPRDYWRLLIDGRYGIREIPPERWSLAGFYDAVPDKPNRSISKWGGFLDDIAAFDPAFFGFTGAEARSLDPQQRLLLMVAYEAVQDAGLTLSDLTRAETGVFVGVSNMDYGQLQRGGQSEPRAGTGTVLSITANRISNCFDLSGPSMAVDTACSSALVALDAACRSLASGACDMAFAGGANVILDPHLHRTFSRAHMLSPTGAIRAFDAKADGFVRGEGIGLVLLKRADAALRDGDEILAVIRATAVNQDGATGTITAPSGQAQRRMLTRLVRQSGRRPADIAFVEAHGTGTPLGDPIEAHAVGEVLGGAGRDKPLYIGSAKTNLGHLEPAAGIAGLIKAVLSLRSHTLPASLGFSQPNPDIAFDAMKLAVPTEPVSLDPEQPCAVVNSFGFGGTNAGALIERGPDAAPAGKKSDHPGWGMPTLPVPLSARSKQQLCAYASGLADFLKPDMPLAAIAATLAARDHFDHRAVVLADSTQSLSDGLRALALGNTDNPGIITGEAGDWGKLAFTTTGQGGQWWAMGRALLERHPVFRESVERFDADFREEAGWSVIDVLTAPEGDDRIHDAAITPAVMFAFQTALAAVWKAIGVTPDILVGHSFGEVTAAALSEAIELRDVPRLARHRGLIRGAVDRVGTMAAIGLGAEAVEPLLPGDGSVEIGAYNGPGTVTVTGDVAAIDDLIARIEQRDSAVRSHRLALDFAYHSSWFDPAEEAFKDALGTIAAYPPAVPVVSSVTGRLETCFDTDYWWRNLRQPVLYQKAIETALDHGARTFVEIGPRRTLSSLTAGIAAGKGMEVATLSTIDGERDDFEALSDAIGALYVQGRDIDWLVLLGDGEGVLSLPRLPWMLDDYWSEAEEARAALERADWHPLLGSRTDDPEPEWSGLLSLDDLAFLGDHRLDGDVLMPAAAMIEMIRAAGLSLFASDGLEIADLRFHQALALTSGRDVRLRTHFEPGRRRITIHSRHRGGGDPWVLRASARILPRDALAEGLPVPITGRPLEAGRFYEQAAGRGYHYGPAFQGLIHAVTGAGCASAEVGEPIGLPHPDDLLVIDPRLLDSCLQLLIAATGDGRYLPERIDRMRISGGLRKAAAAVLTLNASGPGTVSAGLRIGERYGAGRITIEGLHARSIDGRSHGGAEIYRDVQVPVDIANPEPAAASTVLVAGRSHDGGSAELAERIARTGCPIRHLIVSDETMTEALAAIVGARPYAVLIYALTLDSADPVPTTELTGTLTAETRGLLSFGQAVAALDGPARPDRLWVLTRNAREAATPAGVAQSPLAGLTRTLALECSDLPVTLADLDEDGAAVAAALIATGVDETEIIIRAGEVQALRLARTPADTLPPRTVDAAALSSDRTFRAASSGLGGATSLAWKMTPTPVLPPDHVRIAVSAAGLNFRDVMAVSGLLPEEAETGDATARLGLEFAGTVTEAGPAVSGLAIGDKVFGLAPGALAGEIAVDPECLFPIPEGWSMAEASALPVAYLTAHYALRHMGRIAEGERVLIHSAAGGVGLAAVAVAHAAGAEIFATAGTSEKRDYLESLGISQIACSRSLDFADAFREATNGEGMDLVLNGLAGEHLDASLNLLAPHGRFLELGKRDIYGDGAMDLNRLTRNRSFHAIDVLALLEDQPQAAARHMREVVADLRSGRLETLPVTSFAASDIQAAFGAFGNAEHKGKIVVTLDEPDLPVSTTDFRADPESTYLVTGGGRGFGLAAGRWLAERGAGRVILASRSGRAGEPVSAPLEPRALDVTDKAAVAELIAEIEASPYPLRGVLHGAVVYEDAPIDAITPDQLSRVLGPKAIGAIHLTDAVVDAGANLDFFVSLSSLAQVIGWPGQASYAAANSSLEALTAYQRARGIPGQCLNMGALAQSGFVARNPAMQDYLSNAGWGGLDDEAALAGLARVLTCDATVLTYAEADWEALARSHSPLARMPRLKALTEGGAGRATRLVDLEGDALHGAASDLVREQLAALLGAQPSDLTAYETLDDAGVDSLSIFELRNRIEGAIGLPLPVGRFMACTVISDIDDLIVALVAEARLPDEPAADAAE